MRVDDFLLNPIAVATAGLQTFLLIFLRVGGMFVHAPLYGSSMFPVRVRIWLSFFIALVLFPPLQNTQGSILLTHSSGVYLAACMAELGLGILIGFTANILLHGLLIAGHVIDTEMSFTLAQVFDPVNNQNTSLTGQLLFIGGTVLFISMDGHHLALRALAFSFDRIPLAGVTLTDGMLNWILTEMAPQVFIIGVTFAAPVMAAVFLSTVGMGLMARVVPEMNIFAFAFAVRIGVGFIFLTLSVSYLVPVVERLVDGTYGHLLEVIGRGGG